MEAEIAKLQELLKKEKSETKHWRSVVEEFETKGMDFGQYLWSESTTYMPMDNITKGARFRRLRTKINSWAKDNVKPSSQFNLEGNEREAFFRELAKVAVVEGEDRKEFPRGLNDRIATKLVLTALLSHHLYTSIFATPFFFLGQHLSEGLSDIFSLGKAWNLRNAYEWRAKTTRLLFPLVIKKKESEADGVKEQVKLLILKGATLAAKDFARSPARYIVAAEETEIFQDLKDLYTEAAMFSYEMGVQKQYLKVSSSDLLGVPFSHDSGYDADNKFELHGSMDMSESEAKPWPISMVLFPSVEAIGDRSQFTDYSVGKVLSEAVVWMHVPETGKPEDETEVVKQKLLRQKVDSPESESPGARLLRGFDAPTLPEMIQPYLDALVDDLQPLIEGLRDEIKQLKSKGNGK